MKAIMLANTVFCFQIVTEQPESLSAGRPRRSTRSAVDYAHPDVATVVAEQEDLENEVDFVCC